jgi:calcineurin-like phosphoesterase family protein
MSDIYFSSDYHLGHYNIIKYCNRPFSSIAEMNERIIQNHNSIIKPKDKFYFLGDFAMSSSYSYLLTLMGRLNGEKYIIAGNHDKASRFEQMVIDGAIESFSQVMPITIGKQYIWLSHYPHVSWNRSHHDSWNLHGHVHATLKPQYKPFRVDVGVDAWDYKPVSFEQLVEYKKKLNDEYEAIMHGVYL